MNAFEGVIDDLNTSNFAFIESEMKDCNKTWKAFNNLIKNIKNAVQSYKETGVGPEIDFENWETLGEVEIIETPADSQKRSSLKENIQPNENGVEESDAPPKGRPRRNAFKEATQNISHQSSLSLNMKLRRPKVLTEDFQNVFIKEEKMSTCGLEQLDTLEIKVKTENEEMPAPSRPAPKKKKQKKTETKIRIKQERIEEPVKTLESQNRDSDVIIQDVPVTMVNVLDSDDNDKTLKNEEENVRSTRTKTKKKLGKRTRVLSSDEENTHITEKRSKSGSEKPPNGDLTTDINYEDAVSTVEGSNMTFVAKSPINKNLGAPLVTMNTTIVVSNPKYINNNNLIPRTTNDLMTDDESEDEKRRTPPRTVTKTVTKPTKQIFSPFEPSPVKKKVQAFEKLRQEANAIPVRVTRTKTRVQAKEQEAVDSNETETRSIVKEKAKIFTPMTSKFIPTAVSTTVKVNRLNTPSSSNESLLSKSASAVKASQAELRDRERKRREKEQEALKKREALMQAQIEEKKRKREEKQLKAQQQREALEKEKLKVLEIQRLKDERHKQLLAEQEERKQRQKEELEKKRLMAKMRAIEEKRKEEEKRLEEQRKVEEMSAKLAKQDEVIGKMVQKQKMQREQKQQQVPVYMEADAPLLPTPDCYDSDDEEYKQVRVNEPAWARGGCLREMHYCMMAAGDAVKNTFFSRQAHTPNLQYIFEVIEPRKLKRSSSAVWHKPPRYTMMPILDEHSESDELSEDD